MAVAMRHRFQRDVIDARQAGRLTARQARQLAAVARRQVPAGGADLLLDQVEIVEQPFTGRRDRALGLDRRGEQIEGAQQGLLVRRQPRQQEVGDAPAGQRMDPGQRLAVAAHLPAAEQLGAQRRWFVDRLANPVVLM